MSAYKDIESACPTVAGDILVLLNADDMGFTMASSPDAEAAQGNLFEPGKLLDLSHV